MTGANWCQLVPNTNSHHRTRPAGEMVPIGAAPFREAPIGTTGAAPEKPTESERSARASLTKPDSELLANRREDVGECWGGGRSRKARIAGIPARENSRCDLRKPEIQAQTHGRLPDREHRDAIADRWRAMVLHLAGQPLQPLEPALVNGLRRLLFMPGGEAENPTTWRIVRGRLVKVAPPAPKSSSGGGLGR